jgi:hypothetical protein
MAITSVTAPQWGDLEHTFINCVVTTDNTGTEQLPFTASPNDIEPSGQQVFQDCVNGVYGAIAPYTPPPPPVPVTPTAQQNKQFAIIALQATDWVAEPDVVNPPVGPRLVNQQAFLEYRGELRTIAVYPQAGFLNWPVKPTEQWA